MIKTIELILVAVLLIFAFFAGVKYSESVKSHASWLFESKGEEEVELPDLSSESNVEITVPGEVVPAENAAAPQDVVSEEVAPAPAPVAPAAPTRAHPAR
jgi:hypothetical protein